METNDKLKEIRDSLHALAQPLAAVTGTVDLLLLECDENSPILPELQMLSEQLQRVLEIIADMRRLAREPLPEPKRFQVLPD
jgi:signal transduction histidine kinase